MSENENTEQNEAAEIDESGVLTESDAQPRSTSLSTFALIGLALLTGYFGFKVYELQDMVTSLKSEKTQVTKSESLFSEPADLESVIAKVKKSTVTVYCGNYSGSGWAMDLLDDPDTTEDDDYPYEIITNHHVIEDCIDGSDVWFSRAGSQVEYRAFIYSWDKREDMAMLMTAEKVAPLTLAPTSDKPAQGHWVMAVGSPGVWDFDLTGSVTFGHVTNIDEYVVVTDAAINPGNSGGPLVNSRGHVIATNSWGEYVDEWDNINYSQGNPVLCRVLVDCVDSDFDW